MSVDLEIVRRLVQVEPYEQPSGITVDYLPSDWWYVFEERAAIMEYDGGLTRKLAEVKAFEEVVKMIKAEKH